MYTNCLEMAVKIQVFSFSCVVFSYFRVYGKAHWFPVSL